MSTDRKLLEMAAKAAGMNAEWKSVRTSRVGAFRVIEHRATEHLYIDGKPWAPLADDGDALRLCVRLELSIVCAKRIYVAKSPSLSVMEEAVDDVCAATRRAIVRAAAEIGKAMP